MKSNQKSKTFRKDDTGYAEVVPMIVAFLLAIIIGVMIYFAIEGGVSAFDSTKSEAFTSDSDGNSFARFDKALTGSNYTGEKVRLEYSAKSVSSLVAWNGTGSDKAQQALGSGDYSIVNEYLNIYGNATATTDLTNYTQINVTYVSNIASNEGGTTDMAGTVFQLLPIVALVLVAAIILGIILGFGKGGIGKGGGL